MIRTLVTWSDRGRDGPSPAHHGPRPSSDRGPVLRLVEHGEGWDRALVLTTDDGRRSAAGLVRELREVGLSEVELRVLDIEDPTDHAQLFSALTPLVTEFAEHADRCIDVCLSAGTPQMQTLWVILVEAGLLRARMLQVIPAAFVPDPHPHPIRVVRLDIEGFPEIRAMREELVRLRAQTRARGALIGESEPMQLLSRRLARVAQADVPVLVLGETGTGKELVARAIHAASERASGPFVAENCGSFSEGVLASELFGHERGAFSGAARRHRGLFEQAHRGTLFLDELGETSPRVQVMLLRVLQEGRLRRLGGEEEIEVDVRVIAATHRDLPAMIGRGEFREDLWYRLRGATLELPPLRERGRDLELLVSQFLDEDGGRRLWPTPEAWSALRAYAWPGNVRELRAEVVRWRVFFGDDDADGRIGLDALSPEIRGARVRAPATNVTTAVVESDDGPKPLREQIEAVEREAIAAALRWAAGNLSRTARALGIDRNTLKAKLARHGLR
jgi:DNA-binding NtrC family response regulator